MSAHVIETLSLELRHPHGRFATQSHGLHERLMRFLRSEGLRQIERLFDELAPRLPEPSLDRLVLDLGRLHSDQDEREWSERLRLALEAALLPGARQAAGQPPAAATQPLQHFLAYLERGHLPWQLTSTPQGSLSRWLAWLVQQQGPQLWRSLERHPAGPVLLQRLRQISPHEGLQALLAQRDPGLGRQMAALDEHALLPLQASGRLSAYERQRLQQVLRAQALDLLWEARGRPLGDARRRRLLQALQAELGRALGSAWQARLQPLAPPSDEPGLLQDLLRGHAPPPDGQDLTPDDTPGTSPGRVWEASLLRLRPLLDGGRPLSQAQRSRLLQQLRVLASHHAQALGQRLKLWMQDAPARRRWALALDPASFGGLLGCLGPASVRAPETLPLPQASPAVHWAESLRQAALRLQRRALPGLQPGLSRLQSLLMEACLDALARGERLPDTHAGWQRFWEAAWRRWERPDRLPQRRAPRPDSSTAAMVQDPWLPPAPPRTEARAGPETPPSATLDRALQGLARQCEQGRWQWPQRLRLARLLSSEQACARWVRLFDESRRWQMLRAQFGAATQGLQQRAGRLLRWLGQAMQEPAAALAEHWRRLCRVLFLEARAPEAETLRQAYQQLRPPTPTAAARPAVSEREPIWVDDAGQVLLAAYAERLFKHLELLDQGRFRDESARAVAVQCLQRLCHGEQPREECDSVLSRLLCGASPSTVLPATPPLPPQTLALLEQMLQAVISHWKALGNTSVAGLREAFLQRQGRLMREKPRADAPPAWRLRVEKRGLDVLLDRLPWSFSTIRLPWMEGVLHVEWR
ncbi:contractile injection system tape measure protein [Roseateles sp. DB2]|uniref:contractile injection system tape measure protein n=1 Tax=Roseateles sp. DB2 TaxID=3453717 RepID=UPI003EEF26D0